MERKAKKGKHTGFYSLGSYTFMAELRTHSTLKKCLLGSSIQLEECCHSAFLTKVRLKYQKPSLICICPFGLLFLLFLASSWFHDGVEKTIDNVLCCLWDKRVLQSSFPLPALGIVGHLVIFVYPSGPTISWLIPPWGGRNLPLVPSHSQRKHLWHLDEVLGWLRASSQCQGLEYSKCN